MDALSQAFRVLGDSTRLRILRLLGEAPLNVSELVSVVGVAQSSVSHHLAKLKALDLIGEARHAGFTYYSLTVEKGDPRWPLVSLATGGEDTYGDRARLTELLRTREDHLGANERLLEPGQSWMLWALALSRLLPPLEVADFGCGTGVLTVEIARWARRVTAIDRNPAALEQATERARREKLDNITFVQADLEAPLAVGGKKDLVVVSQSLHHVAHPQAVLGEAGRLLKPGGRLVVLELLPHDEQWVKERLGHVHLGFPPDELVRAAEKSGIKDVEVTSPPREGATPFRAFLLTGAKK